MPNFEVFTRGAARGKSEPMVSILKRRGDFALNRLAVEALGRPATVELLFDRTERLIGLRPTDPDKLHAYQLRRQPKSSGFQVAGQAFTQYYGIPTDRTRRYRARMVDGVLIVDLKEHGATMSTPKRGRGRERTD